LARKVIVAASVQFAYHILRLTLTFSVSAFLAGLTVLAIVNLKTPLTTTTCL